MVYFSDCANTGRRHTRRSPDAAPPPVSTTARQAATLSANRSHACAEPSGFLAIPSLRRAKTHYLASSSTHWPGAIRGKRAPTHVSRRRRDYSRQSQLTFWALATRHISRRYSGFARWPPPAHEEDKRGSRALIFHSLNGTRRGDQHARASRNSLLSGHSAAYAPEGATPPITDCAAISPMVAIETSSPPNL